MTEQDLVIQQLRRELKAAKEDIERSCRTCKSLYLGAIKDTVDCATCDNYCNWEWRGVKR